MTKTELCAVSDVPVNGVRKVSIEGHEPFAVYNLDNEFYVTQDDCTHGIASLSEGEIEDGVIYCPFHGGAFDIKTGQPCEHPCVVPISTWKTHVENERVFVELAG